MQSNFNKEIKEVIKKNNPDKEIEVFWFGLKQSIINFMGVYETNIPINTWSILLNWYQVNKDYSNIKKYIHIFISYYCIYIFKYHDSYYTSILWTNVKRWLKINNNNLLEDSDRYYFNVYHLLLDIYRIIILKNDKKYDDILLFYNKVTENFVKEDIYDLVDLSIENNLGNIIDKLNRFNNINSYIESKYSIKIPYKMSGKKIIKKISDL